MVAFMPDAQTLLTVVQTTVFGIPAPKAACLAGACPKLALKTLPKKTSCTRDGSTFALLRAASIAIEPSFVAGKEDKPPRKLPIGVRAIPTTHTSLGSEPMAAPKSSSDLDLAAAECTRRGPGGVEIGEEDKTKGESPAAGPGAGAPPAAKAQVVGWPPVRSYRKNTLAANATKTKAESQGRSEAGCCYVKVSMDGAPYLRKVDLKTYSSYDNLSLELEKMFSCFITGKSSSCKTSTRDRLTDGSRADALQDQEYVLTYEDKDADWMLVGDLPWDLFTTTCRKLRIMRGSDAAGMV